MDCCCRPHQEISSLSLDNPPRKYIRHCVGRSCRHMNIPELHKSQCTDPCYTWFHKKTRNSYRIWLMFDSLGTVGCSPEKACVMLLIIKITCKAMQYSNGRHSCLSFASRTNPSLHTHLEIPQDFGHEGTLSGNIVHSQEDSHSRLNSGQSENSSLGPQSTEIT